MPRFGNDDRDRASWERLKARWAEQRKEQVMSEVKPLTEQEMEWYTKDADTFDNVWMQPHRVQATIDHWRQRAEQAEADRKVLRNAVQTLAHSIWTEYGSAGTTWMDVVDAKCDDETSAALGRAK